MTLALAVGLAGALGTLLRFGLDVWGRRSSHPGSFPWALLTVNALGSALVGFLAGYTKIPAELIILGTVGIAGGLTTFSSLSVSTISSYQAGRRRQALLIIVSNVALGLFCTYLGLAATSALL